MLRAANLFILPSYFEGLSISLLEAMAHGVPALASDIPGNNDLITSGVNGGLFPAGNVQAISQSIQESLASPDRSASWASEALQMVQDKYSLTSMVEAHLALFEQLVA